MQAISSLNDPGPLFVVGMPRSGTKLARNLLNQHSRISIPRIETEFLPALARNLHKYGDVSNRAGFDRLYAHLIKANYFDFKRLEGEVLSADKWFLSCRSFDAAGIFEAFIRAEVGAPPGSGIFWGDKSPSYIDDIPLIIELYPNARILHIVRDVRDYCLSINHAWKKNMLRAAERWSDSVMLARRDGAKIGAQFLEVRYEDLIANAEPQLRRICEFVDIDFEPAMLTLSMPSENIGSTRGETRIVGGNSGKFSHQMSRKLLSRIEALAGDALESYGYVLVGKRQVPRRLSSVERFIAQCMDGYNLVRSDRENLGLLRGSIFYIRYFLTTRE